MTPDSGRTSAKYLRVLAIGVFDLFHVGHLRYLQYARSAGLHLSVAITPDTMCLAVKNKQPVIPQDQRMEIIRSLGWIDVAALLPTSTEETQATARWIQAWGINHVVAGGGWSGSPRWSRLIPALAERNISVGFAPHTNGVSSSQIIASIRQNDTVQRCET